MDIFSFRISLNTKKDAIYDITKDVEGLFKKASLKEGSLNIFSIGSTCSIFLMEYKRAF